LIGGQYLDLNPPLVTKQVLEEIFDRKTCVLFDLAFVFGWLLGGGDFEKLPEVSNLATCFGRPFQILDDIEDMAQDKAANKRINFALCFGEEAAKQEARDYIDKFVALAKELGLGESPLLTLTLAMRP
jgi:geranylgeranyl diphosphate synthase type II